MRFSLSFDFMQVLLYLCVEKIKLLVIFWTTPNFCPFHVLERSFWCEVPGFNRHFLEVVHMSVDVATSPYIGIWCDDLQSLDLVEMLQREEEMLAAVQAAKEEVTSCDLIVYLIVDI